MVKVWYHTIRTYPVNIKKFIWANAFLQIGLGMFSVMYNLYIKSIGFSELVNGRVISMQSLATAIMLIPAGFIGDRFGRKYLLLYGSLLSGFTLIIRSLIETQSLLVFFAFLTGLFYSFVQVSMVPFMADYSKDLDRVSLFSFNFAMQMAANMIGNILGGILSDGIEGLFHLPEEYSLKITLMIGAIFFLISVIPLWQIKEKKRTMKKQSKEQWNFRKNKDQFIIIMKFTTASLIIGSGSGLVIPYLNLYFRDRFDASYSSIGFVVSLGQLATALAMLIGPALVKRVGEVKGVVILQLSSIPFLLLTGYTKIYVVAILGFLFRQALMNAGNPIQQALMMEKVDDSMKGVANSLGQMVFNLGWAFMGPISTAIVARGGSYYGYATVFTITTGLYIIGSFYFFYMLRGIKVKRTI